MTYDLPGEIEPPVEIRMVPPEPLLDPRKAYVGLRMFPGERAEAILRSIAAGITPVPEDIARLLPRPPKGMFPEEVTALLEDVRRVEMGLPIAIFGDADERAWVLTYIGLKRFSLWIRGDPVAGPWFPATFENTSVWFPRHDLVMGSPDCIKLSGLQVVMDCFDKRYVYLPLP